MAGDLRGWIVGGVVYCVACSPTNDAVPVFDDTQVFHDLYCETCGEPVASTNVIGITGAVFPQKHPGTTN